MPLHTIVQNADSLLVDQRTGSKVAITQVNVTLDVSILQYPSCAVALKALFVVPSIELILYYDPYIFGKSLDNELILMNVEDNEWFVLAAEINLFAINGSKVNRS
jgi:hypothetical protein